MRGFKIREAQILDVEQLLALYKNTILAINQRDYTKSEVEDWVSCGDNLEQGHLLVQEHHCILAENAEGIVVGFASINGEGYIHTLFVHSDFQNQGIATLLYDYLEHYAIGKGFEKLTSEVSITAKPFFEKQGFRVDAEQKRKANKLFLTNYKMSKEL